MRVGQLCDIVAWEREEVGVSVALRCVGRCEIRGELTWATSQLPPVLRRYNNLVLILILSCDSNGYFRWFDGLIVRRTMLNTIVQSSHLSPVGGLLCFVLCCFVGVGDEQGGGDFSRALRYTSYGTFCFHHDTAAEGFAIDRDGV